MSQINLLLRIWGKEIHVMQLLILSLSNYTRAESLITQNSFMPIGPTQNIYKMQMLLE